MLPFEIKNQYTFEGKIYEENLYEKRIQAFISSTPQESKGFICYSPFQDFEFHDTPFSSLEEESLMEEHLFDEENDEKEIDNFDSLLHIERHN